MKKTFGHYTNILHTLIPYECLRWPISAPFYFILVFLLGVDKGCGWLAINCGITGSIIGDKYLPPVFAAHDKFLKLLQPAINKFVRTNGERW